MKYETPELTALTPAINAIQAGGSKGNPAHADNPVPAGNELIATYADWE